MPPKTVASLKEIKELGELKDLFQKRLKDRRQSRTRRRIRIDASPKAFNDILPDFFDESPNTMKKIEETRALIAWEKYVGKAAAQYSKAVRLVNGSLTVRVSDPLWMQQLLLLKQDFLRNYRKDFPKLGIQNIFFTR